RGLARRGRVEASVGPRAGPPRGRSGGALYPRRARGERLNQGWEMRFRSVRMFLGLSVCGVVAFAGCRNYRSIGPGFPVPGQCTLGGKPLVGGTVSFIPLEAEANRPRPEGSVDARGRYSLKTAGREGAPAGKYRAIVTTSGDDKNQDEQFDPQYSHWEK